MVHAVVAVIAIIFLLMIYGALMLFSDYMKAALYIKVFFLNLIWFIVATGFKEYDVYYPDVFGNKWLNFLLMATAFMLLTFEISRFVKLRNAVLLTVGTVTHMFIALMIVNFCGGMPGWAVSVYLTISSCIIFGIHLAAIYGGKNTEAGGFVSRALAGILMMPAPFLITSGCMLTLSSNNEKIINTMPLKDFIQQVYDFVRNPDFNYSGTVMLTGMKYTRQMFLTSLIVAILVFVIYLVIDSTVDYRSDMKERSKHRKEAEKERVRAEISSRIHAQLEKIDSCMAYISSNYKTLKVKDSDMRQLRTYYDEATRIKYSYTGAASGPILKRLTELKTEIFVIRDRILNDHAQDEDEKIYQEKEREHKWKYQEFSEREEQKANEERQARQAQQEKREREESQPEKSIPSTKSGYFNGCSTEEELKKRYRDLCKVFHPDSENGDQETFLKIKEDYEYLIGKAANL